MIKAKSFTNWQVFVLLCSIIGPLFGAGQYIRYEEKGYIEKISEVRNELKMEISAVNTKVAVMDSKMTDTRDDVKEIKSILQGMQKARFPIKPYEIVQNKDSE